MASEAGGLRVMEVACRARLPAPSAARRFHASTSLVNTEAAAILPATITPRFSGMAQAFFGTQQGEKGTTPAVAIVEACSVRFRPIMMTTLAALMGAIPTAVRLGPFGVPDGLDGIHRVDHLAPTGAPPILAGDSGEVVRDQPIEGRVLTRAHVG